jgi:hypothetical protein
MHHPQLEAQSSHATIKASAKQQTPDSNADLNIKTSQI